MNFYQIAIAATFLLMIIGGGSVSLNNKDLPRGIRNNNAGNIRKGIAWQGMAASQPDASFITFIAPEYGLRAIARILRTYQEKYGLNTIRQVIARWAPPMENNTEAYITAVAAHVGESPDAPLDFTKQSVVVPMMEAITRQENGQQPYSVATMQKAATMAGALV